MTFESLAWWQIAEIGIGFLMLAATVFVLAAQAWDEIFNKYNRTNEASR